MFVSTFAVLSIFVVIQLCAQCGRKSKSSSKTPGNDEDSEKRKKSNKAEAKSKKPYKPMIDIGESQKGCPEKGVLKPLR